jgi:threonine dehydratase
MTLPVTLADVEAARETLRGVVRMTPIETSRILSEMVGGPVYFKCENLQRGGSFKVRGAYNRMSGLTNEEKARGVVAASAGNHAQGVALAAQMLGIHAVIFMPETAALPKVSATRGYGADVELVGTSVDATLEAALEYSEKTGAILVHPFDNPRIVAGQGTVGLEILEQVPDVRTIVVPVGGGGIAAGIAVAVHEQRPDIQVIGVQSELVAALPISLDRGEPTAVDVRTTMADGIAVGRPGFVPFDIMAALANDVRVVSEDAMSRALLLCLERAKLVVEPAGAAGVAAVLDAPSMFEPPVVVVLTGANIDPLLMLRVLRHGLAVSGRFVSLRLWLQDIPGSLVRLLDELAQSRANIVAIEHRRIDPRLEVDEVEVSLQLETRGAEHIDEIVALLRGHGYAVEVD